MRQPLSLLLALCLAVTMLGCQELEDPAPSPSDTPAPSPTQPVEAMQFSLGYDPSASRQPGRTSASARHSAGIRDNRRIM